MTPDTLNPDPGKQDKEPLWREGERFRPRDAELEPQFYVQGEDVLFDYGRYDGKLSNLTIESFEDAIRVGELVSVDAPAVATPRPTPAAAEAETFGEAVIDSLKDFLANPSAAKVEQVKIGSPIYAAALEAMDELHAKMAAAGIVTTAMYDFGTRPVIAAIYKCLLAERARYAASDRELRDKITAVETSLIEWETELDGMADFYADDDSRKTRNSAIVRWLNEAVEKVSSVRAALAASAGGASREENSNGH